MIVSVLSAEENLIFHNFDLINLILIFHESIAVRVRVHVPPSTQRHHSYHLRASPTYRLRSRS